MSFPKIIFGTCPRCGGKGADDPNASDADATARDTDGNGVILEYYRGELFCEICKKEKIAEEETELEAQKDTEAQEFRAKAGFQTTIT